MLLFDEQIDRRLQTRFGGPPSPHFGQLLTLPQRLICPVQAARANAQITFYEPFMSTKGITKGYQSFSIIKKKESCIQRV